jgi:TPR repeat protein
MSAPMLNETNDRLLQTPTMYAPPWAREEARAASEAAADNAVAASEEFRRVLPPAPLLAEPARRTRWREPAPFDGDLAAVRLRERASLDPVAVPPPPLRQRGSVTGVLVARIAGAIGLAALAALLMVGMPLKGAVKAESETALPSIWSRFGAATPGRQAADAQPAEVQVAALAERFAAAPAADPLPARPAPVQVAAQAAPVEPAPRLRALGSDEIAALYRRSEELVAQGDIAAARLLLTRAAEAGDPRAALALGATYAAAVLARLAVIGVAADGSRARAWYEKAAELGSGEAAKRLEQLAQVAR